MGKTNTEENAKTKKSHTSVYWLRKTLESFICVIPIVLTVLVLFWTGLTPDFDIQSLTNFLLCAFMIAIGLTLFNAGSEQSMSRIGQVVGESLFKHKKLWVVVLMTFLIGVLVTIAEPDLKVMATQIGWDEWLLIVCIGVGVGLFVVLGVLRILFKKNLNVMFIAFYGIVFALASIMNPKFLPIAFDSGGVTTGPVTVPFILAFGAGLAASKSSSGRNSDDSFGLTALASVGPIITVMIMSLFIDVDGMTWDPLSVSSSIDFASWEAFWPSFGKAFGTNILGELQSVALAIVPIFIFFVIYNLIFVRLSFKQLLKIFIGLIYAYVGLVFFLSAVNTGFLPVAVQIGKALGDPTKNLYPIAIVVGALFGLFGVLAEPAVHVLVGQIETVSEGTIKSRTVLAVMAIAIAGGVALAVVRAHYGFSILYYLVPGYILACGLTFLVPKIYSSIAFDSGGVASGPMASTFVMPFCIGFTYASHGADYVYKDAFGCVAMIALMPIIVIQLMGLYAEVKRSLIYRRTRQRFIEPNDNQIIHMGEGSI